MHTFLGILLFLLVIIVVVTVHELGHFIFAKLSRMYVSEFGIGFPPKAIGLGKIKGTPITLNWLPLGGFVKIAGEDGDLGETIPEGQRRFGAAPKRLQALVLIGGVLGNMILGIVLFSVSFMIGVPTLANPGQPGTVIIAQVSPDSPAELAGLQTGDNILSVNNQKVSTAEDTVKYLAETKSGKSVDLEIERGHKITHTLITPSYETGSPKIGVALDAIVVQKSSFFKSIWLGIKTTGQTFWGVLKGLGLLIAGLFHGDKALLESVSGPVGIATATMTAGKFGFAYLVSFVALISVNLAVINLLPFPALDGGRLVVVLIEAITRRKVPPKALGWVNGIGFLILIALILLVTVHDVRNLF